MERILFAEEPQGPRSALERFPNSVFDEIDLIESGSSQRLFFTDATSEVIWPVDYCGAVFKEDHLLVTRFCSASARDMRSIARIFPRYMAWLFHAHIFDDGASFKEKVPMGFVGGSWRPLDIGVITDCGVDHKGKRIVGRRVNDAEVLAGMRDTCTMSLSAELTNRYEWSVSFRIDTSPSLRICTDPSGIKALFKDRDRGNRECRPALKHWVSEHYRQHRVDPDAETFVREHLRGMERFRWCGYDCTINVSPYDLERAEWAKDMRAQRA